MFRNENEVQTLFRDPRGCSKFPPARPQEIVVAQLRLLKQVVNEAAGEKNTGGVPSSGTSRIFLS